MLYKGISQPAHLISASFLIMPISLLAPPSDPNMKILNTYLLKSETLFAVPASLQVTVYSHLPPSLPLTEVSCTVLDASL